MTSPAGNLSLASVLPVISISFPVVISRTTYLDTYAAQSLQSCRNFVIFCMKMKTRFEWGGGREEFHLFKVLGSSPWKPIGCARSVWKWILQGYLIAPGNCLSFVWCHPRRQFPITQLELEANVGMPRLLTRSWQNSAVDSRPKRTYFLVPARIWSLLN